MAPRDLPRLALPIAHEFARPELLGFVERPSKEVHRYGQAHAFISCVDGARVIGSGSLVTDEGIYVHGLSTGNYADNIRMQLEKYETVPDGGEISGDHVLIWGGENFGHWIITYLLRATLIWHRSELLSKPILLSDKTPRRFVEWLKRMGLSRFRMAPDGVKVERLWVPSVVCYRGHYEDKVPYIWPYAVHLLRTLVLRDLIFPHSVREKIYISRAKSKWRRFTNEDELARRLADHGYRRVFMGELTLERQLDLISRASDIVIHAGGDSPVTMFAPMDCRIIELSVPKFVGTFGSRCWAHVLGQPFQRINATPTEKTGALPIDWDATIDVEAVCSRL